MLKNGEENCLETTLLHAASNSFYRFQFEITATEMVRAILSLVGLFGQVVAVEILKKMMSLSLFSLGIGNIEIRKRTKYCTYSTDDAC